LPAKVKKESQELNAIWSVGKGMWKNKYEEVYQTLLSSNWDATLKPLAEALVGSYLINIRACSTSSDQPFLPQPPSEPKPPSWSRDPTQTSLNRLHLIFWECRLPTQLLVRHPFEPGR
jgi:hypothetical protein